jgi:hypothetical protein
VNGVKFGRAYTLTLDSPAFAVPITIGLPFTIEFDILRNSYPSANDATIRIYGLSQYHRAQLVHDQWLDQYNAEASAIYVQLQAGYGPGPIWPIVFKGNVTRGYSQREGNVYVTTLECRDGGLAWSNAYSTIQVPGGTSMQGVYEALINDLVPYGVSMGAVSKAVAGGVVSKGQSFNGSTIDILRELSSGNFFIDNLAANVLGASDAVGGTLTIDSSSGLLNTPIKEQQWLLFDMLFEPRLAVGSLVTINSITGAEVYNGQHKVASIHHKCIISAAVSGDAITHVGVEAGVFSEVARAVGV